MYMVNRKNPVKMVSHCPLSVPPISVITAVYPIAAATIYRALEKKCLHVRDNRNSIITYAATISQKNPKYVPLTDISLYSKVIKVLANR